MEEKENSSNVTGQQLNNCFAMRDDEVNNDGTIEQLYQKLSELLQRVFGI